MDLNHQEVPNRRGAGVARGAHNPEDTGSKPVAGNLSFACFIVLPHNPPASSWGVQKLAVKLDVKRSLCCRCSSAEERLKHRLLPFDYSRGTFWGWLFRS